MNSTDEYAPRMRLLDAIVRITEAGLSATSSNVQAPDGSSAREVLRLVALLSHDGFIDLDQRLAGAWLASPTTRGRDARASFLRRRSSRRERSRALRDEYLEWIYEGSTPSATSPLTPDAFLAEGRGWLGDPYTDTELMEAGAWLAEEGLIDGPTVDQRPDPQRPRITSQGERVAEAGGVSASDQTVRRVSDASYSPSVSESQSSADRRKVFVIHGRNEAARRGLFEFLRALDLDPIEWSEALAMTGRGTPYIGDVLDAAFSAAQAVVVLQTPDDVAYLHESLTEAGDPETQPQLQPRPNVLFEAGMAMGRHEDRTVIVELGRVKSFSDIHGRHVVRLDNSTKRRQELAQRLETVGCAVKYNRTDWHDAGDLTPPAAPGGGLPLGRRVPSSVATGAPRLTARLHVKGGNKIDDVVVTNHGPGDVFELDASFEGALDLQRDADNLPVPRLPASKSVVVLQRMPATFDTKRVNHFMVRLTGKTADGTAIDIEEFVSVD